MTEQAMPILITQNEFMRRMKEMSAMQGGMMGFYGEMPDSYNLVVNTDHILIKNLLQKEEEVCGKEVSPIDENIKTLQTKIDELTKAHQGKKDEEVPQQEKEELENTKKEVADLKEKQKVIFREFAEKENMVRQLIDLALLANNMLKGEALNNFVKRSTEMIAK